MDEGVLSCQVGFPERFQIKRERVARCPNSTCPMYGSVANLGRAKHDTRPTAIFFGMQHSLFVLVFLFSWNFFLLILILILAPPAPPSISKNQYAASLHGQRMSESKRECRELEGERDGGRGGGHADTRTGRQDRGLEGAEGGG